MAFDLSLPSEGHCADCTFEQNLGWHVNHLEMQCHRSC